MFVVAFFAVVAILCCAADDSVTTSLLLPDGLFATNQSFSKPNFLGKVAVAGGITYYTLDCTAGGVSTYFMSGNEECEDESYTFSEESASTTFVVNK